ncbi:MAG: peptide chain release factor N(5)-glutamine methyltransferase [Blastocatellales bacterium]
MATIAETLQEATGRLREAAIPNDVLDAQTLLAYALGCDRTHLIINYREELPEEPARKFADLIERRAKGEPLQYITGRQEFFGLEFEVTPDVLIPRPETELIVEETIRLAQGIETPIIIDVGTGSGCIAVALARELPGARLIATDISPAAIEVARRNAGRYDLEIDFRVTDLLPNDVPPADFVVSNPPYIAESEMSGLQREVRDWEPGTALTDFGDGLGFYRRLLAEAAHRLKPGGRMILELGFSQAEQVTGMIDPGLWNLENLLNDLQGIPRTLVLQRI